MELRQLRYFLSVARLNSFSEASKELFISQSTLSQQIRQLEDELGVILLDRDSRHVSLTEFGERFLPCAKDVINDADACIAKIQDVKELKVGTLNIGTTYSFYPILKETVRSFIRQYPGIKLNIIGSSMEDLMERLNKNEIDVALSYKPLHRYEHIESHILFTSNLSVIVSNQNSIAKMDKIRLSELEKYPLALPAKGLQARDTFESLLYGQKFKFDVRIELNDIQVLLDIVSGGDFATLLSQTTITDIAGLTAVTLDHPGSEMIGSYHILKGNYCKKATRVFLKQLIENNSFSQAIEAFEI